MNFACIDVSSVDAVIGTEKISYVTFVLSVVKKHSFTASTANTKQNIKTIFNAIYALDIK
jgi:hypothetical protein